MRPLISLLSLHDHQYQTTEVTQTDTDTQAYANQTPSIQNDDSYSTLCPTNLFFHISKSGV